MVTHVGYRRLQWMDSQVYCEPENELTISDDADLNYEKKNYVSCDVGTTSSTTGTSLSHTLLTQLTPLYLNFFWNC